MLHYCLLSLLLVACDDTKPLHVEAQVLEVQSDLEPDADPHWKILPGLAQAPTPPAAMVEWQNRVFLAHGSRITEYDPEKESWLEGEAEIALPGEVGSGVALCADGKGGIYLLRGGRQKDFWRLDLAKRRVEVLAAAPTEVGRGAALTFDGDAGKVYALRGDLKRDFWRYDPEQDHWEKLTRVGDKTALAAIGQSTGALQYSQGFVYAWPDHHIQRYDVKEGTWLNHVHMSYGQRPWWDGSAWAKDRDKDQWYVIQGGSSRTLSFFDPNKRGFAFLKPRLPLRMSGEGSRAVVVTVGGKRHLLIYAMQQENRLIRIALDDLQMVTPQSPASDVGSPWVTIHEKGGSSLVRRPAFVPVLGMMGQAGPRWYFGRLQNMRFFDVNKNEWTGYPGIPMGKPFGEGFCGAADPAGLLYVLTGSGKHFVKVDQTAMTATPLEKPDLDIGMGGQAAFAGGRLHVLVGGETRSYRIYDPASKRWSAGPDLPAETTAVGQGGSGLVVAKGRLVAVSGRGVLILSEDGKTWSTIATLPHPLSADGGMVAADPETRRLLLAEGGGSRRLLALDLDDPEHPIEHLLPDVVSVWGMRAVVDTVGGKRCFCIHRGADTHEIFVRPIDELFASPTKK